MRLQIDVLNTSLRHEKVTRLSMPGPIAPLAPSPPYSPLIFSVNLTEVHQKRPAAIKATEKFKIEQESLMFRHGNFIAPPEVS